MNELISTHKCNDSKKLENYNRIRDGHYDDDDDDDDDDYQNDDEEEKLNDDDEIFIETSNENLTDDMHLIANELLLDELNELNLCSKHRKLKCLFKNYKLLRKNSQRSKLNKEMSKKKRKKFSVRQSNSQKSMLSSIIKKINCFSFVE